MLSNLSLKKTHTTVSQFLFHSSCDDEKLSNNSCDDKLVLAQSLK